MTSLLHPDRVEAHGDAWVDAGLISDEQLDAIRRFEHLDTPTTRRFSVPAEIAVYLGSTLALSGGAMVVAQQCWDQRNPEVKVVVLPTDPSRKSLAGQKKRTQWTSTKKEKD